MGAAVGLVMGLSGAGGGILALPSLVYSQGWSMQQAMPVALLAVTCGALAGALEGWRKKLVRYRAALLMAAAGALPTVFGVRLAQHLSQVWLMALFALILLLVAARLLRHAPVADDGGRAVLARINGDTGRFDWTPRTGAVIAAIGGMAGLVTGLLGVGGGFVIVPMLRRYTNLSMHGAVATSLLVIALVGSVGIASALANGATLPAGFSLSFVASTVAGMLAGRRIAAYLPARKVQTLFALLLLAVAASLLLRLWR
ncbi:MAG: sulfite exporter TauE/SafE family protein [Burkholderiales bacterium]|nr:sulfite exporter TauE/SafE family protein [Burkholderiales bacterium]